MHLSGILIAIVVAAVYVTILVTAVRWSRRLYASRADARLAAFEKGLAGSGGSRAGEPVAGGGVYGTDRQVRWTFPEGDLVVEVRYLGRSLMRGALRVAGGVYPWVAIYPETALARFGKAIGLTREVQTGDAAFDALAYVDTYEDDPPVARLLADAALREAIAGLLRRGLKVQFSRAGVEAFELQSSLDAFDPSRLIAATGELRAIAERAPRFDAGELRPPRGMVMPPVVLWGSLATLILGIWTAGGLGAASPALLHAADGAVALFGVGGAGWLLANLAFVRWVRHRSYSLRAVLLFAGCSLVGVTGAVGVGAIFLDGFLDSSDATVHLARVAKKTSSKNGVFFHVVSWEDPERTIEVKTLKAYYDRIPVGDAIPVRAHPGRFGWAWVERAPGVSR